MHAINVADYPATHAACAVQHELRAQQQCLSIPRFADNCSSLNVQVDRPTLDKHKEDGTNREACTNLREMQSQHV